MLDESFILRVHFTRRNPVLGSKNSFFWNKSVEQLFPYNALEKVKRLEMGINGHKCINFSVPNVSIFNKSNIEILYIFFVSKGNTIMGNTGKYQTHLLGNKKTSN